MLRTPVRSPERLVDKERLGHTDPANHRGAREKIRQVEVSESPVSEQGIFTILTKFNTNSWVTTGLTDDHPVGYDLPNDVNEYSQTPSTAKLYGGAIECASCHDPHGTTYGVKFLRAQDFCSDCHNKQVKLCARAAG
jgi:predicted CXXCH cytochrome family protein